MWLEHIHTRRLQVLKPGALTRNNLGGNCWHLLLHQSEGATSGGDLLCLICLHRRNFLKAALSVLKSSSASLLRFISSIRLYIKHMCVI